MILARILPKSTPRWTCGTVAVIVALGLLWLALEGGRGHTDATSGGSAGLYSTADPLHSAPAFLRGWELGYLPPSLAPALAEPANENHDNLTALTLGGAGALALTGLALLLAWKRRPNLSWWPQGQRSRLPRVPRRVSSI